MQPMMGTEDYDMRNHRSVLIPGYEQECLSDLRVEERSPINVLKLESLQLWNDELEDFVDRHIALGVGIGGERVKVLARIAVHDEQQRLVETEDVSHAAQAPQPQV